jgi:hypothetical protein
MIWHSMLILTISLIPLSASLGYLKRSDVLNIYIIYIWAVFKSHPSYVGFEVLTAVTMNSTILWNIAPCSQLKVNRRFGGRMKDGGDMIL